MIAPIQLDMTAILSPETIELEARIADEKASRESERREMEAQLVADRAARAAERREMAEARLEAQKIARGVAARRKSRKCLSCGDNFASAGAGNRICSPCKGAPVFGSMPDFSVHASF